MEQTILCNMRCSVMHRLSVIENRLDAMENKDKDDSPYCFFCGGALYNASNGKFICRQEHGLCGELLVTEPTRQLSRGPKAFFHKTTYSKSLKLENFVSPVWKPVYHAAFAAGVCMTIEDYLALWNVGSDHYG